MMLVVDVVSKMGRFVSKMGQSVGETRVGELSRCRGIGRGQIGYTPMRQVTRPLQALKVLVKLPLHSNSTNSLGYVCSCRLSFPLCRQGVMTS